MKTTPLHIFKIFILFSMPVQARIIRIIADSPYIRSIYLFMKVFNSRVSGFRLTQPKPVVQAFLGFSFVLPQHTTRRKAAALLLLLSAAAVVVVGLFGVEKFGPKVVF